MVSSLRDVIYALFWFGEFRSDCYYCERTLKSRNLAVIEFKRATHLAFTHDKDPEEIPDDEYDAVCDEMKIYAEDKERDEFVEVSS